MDILFIADPLTQFKIYKDSTYAMMAEAARDYSRNRAVETLAQSIINSQTSEVETMTTMLEERGAKPLAD